ncbi:hypothetical protein POTOM_027223 [Populus tomentosa]|uniref:Dihydroorotate dehydrogenase catalytic domain-containing protein n=1 Tax=Populus tomentosa TaxID=118781 RepID=A0A8X7ZGH2_POPTO|nr:hypothetical protein POTOM_027223 [Populus tomentosa]
MGYIICKACDLILFGLNSVIVPFPVSSKFPELFIGCGGVFSGEYAYKKIRVGATLVQLYTGFSYGGPALIPGMKVTLQCVSAFLERRLENITLSKASFGKCIAFQKKEELRWSVI